MFETAAASQWLLRACIPYVCNVRYFLASRGEGSVFHSVPITLIRMSVHIRLKEFTTFSALKHTSWRLIASLTAAVWYSVAV